MKCRWNVTVLLWIRMNMTVSRGCLESVTLLIDYCYVTHGGREQITLSSAWNKSETLIAVSGRRKERTVNARITKDVTINYYICPLSSSSSSRVQVGCHRCTRQHIHSQAGLMKATAATCAQGTLYSKTKQYTWIVRWYNEKEKESESKRKSVLDFSLCSPGKAFYLQVSSCTRFFLP